MIHHFQLLQTITISPDCCHMPVPIVIVSVDMIEICIILPFGCKDPEYSVSVTFLINHDTSLCYLQTLVICTTGIIKQPVSASSFQIYLLQENASVLTQSS